MAFIVKTRKATASGPSNSGYATLSQFIQVTTAARALPQTSTDQIFQVTGGRVLIHRLIGTVTTVIQSSDPVMKLSAKKLNAAMATAVGTAVDVASTVDVTSLEVGGTVIVIGSGAALVKNNAGAIISTLGTMSWIVPNGELYLTTGASKTGAFQWDIWYQPLDAGATVTSVLAATAAV